MITVHLTHRVAGPPCSRHNNAWRESWALHISRESQGMKESRRDVAHAGRYAGFGGQTREWYAILRVAPQMGSRPHDADAVPDSALALW